LEQDPWSLLVGIWVKIEEEDAHKYHENGRQMAQERMELFPLQVKCCDVAASVRQAMKFNNLVADPPDFHMRVGKWVANA